MPFPTTGTNRKWLKFPKNPSTPAQKGYTQTAQDLTAPGEHETQIGGSSEADKEIVGLQW